MGKLRPIKLPAVYGGRCCYSDLSVYTETDRPYEMDKWSFHIDTISIQCMASKEVLTVNAYLPPHIWGIANLSPLPEVVQGWSLAFDEPFDVPGRVASESLPYKVLCDPGRRVIEIVFGEPSGWPEFVVSPHQDFLVGADPDRAMSLSSVWLLNVDGFPEKPGEMWPGYPHAK